jgi:hypothetical protein
MNDPCEPDDLAMLNDMANEQLSLRTVRWICVYCGHEVPEQWSPHCGEAGHTEPMPEGDDDADF